MLEWLQILSSHVPDASIVLVGTHSKTPEGKDKPGVFKDGAYAEEYAKLAVEVQRKVVDEINRLNCIVEQELMHLQRRVLPLVGTRLDAATQLWQELQACAYVLLLRLRFPRSSRYRRHYNRPHRVLYSRAIRIIGSFCCSRVQTRRLLDELRRYAEEVLHLAAAGGCHSGAHAPPMRCPRWLENRGKMLLAVKMRLMMTSQVDSSNQSGIARAEGRVVVLLSRAAIRWRECADVLDHSGCSYRQAAAAVANSV